MKIKNNISEGGFSILIGVDALAELLNVSPSTVRRLVDSGKMPQPIRLGKAVRWQRVEIENWIREGCPACRQGGRGC